MGDLIILKRVMEPQARAMQRQLTISGQEWDALQSHQSAEGKRRSYRVVEACEGSVSRPWMSDLSELMFDDIGWSSVLPATHMTAGAAATIFRLLGREGAGVHQKLEVPHSSFPYLLFSLLAVHAEELENRATHLLSLPRCTRDPFARWWFSHYSSPAALISPLALEELRSVAMQVATDIASSECKHAANRREIEGKSVHTHRCSHTDVSALVTRSVGHDLSLATTHIIRL